MKRPERNLKGHDHPHDRYLPSDRIIVSRVIHGPRRRLGYNFLSRVLSCFDSIKGQPEWGMLKSTQVWKLLVQYVYQR